MKMNNPLTTDERIADALEKIAAAFEVTGAPACAGETPEERRLEAAKTALQGLLSGGDVLARAGKQPTDKTREMLKGLADMSVCAADALLAALDRPAGGAA